MAASIGKDPAAKTRRIRDLNDALRQNMSSGLGTTVLTAGVAALSTGLRDQVIQEVAAFDDFTEDNDPHGEHDFGSFGIEGRKFFWKIDYYAPDMEGGSSDPADPTVTKRVLTIMFAEEY